MSERRFPSQAKRGWIQSHTERVYEPVNACIYCGCDPSSDSQCALTDEHIVPLALGGPWVLPKSSCTACAKITGKLEAKVLRGGLRSSREVLEFPSRAKVGPGQLPVFSVNGDEAKKVMIDLADYPTVLALPHYAGPRLVSLPESLLAPSQPWHRVLRIDPETLATKYGIRSFAPMSIDCLSFARMLCKISHGFAVAEMGFGNFIPYLPPVILGERTDYLMFVGSLVNESEPSEHMHGFDLVAFGDPGARIIACNLRLFSNFGAPPYRVIVGTYHGELGMPPDSVTPDLSSEEYAERVRVMIEMTKRPFGDGSP